MLSVFGKHGIVHRKLISIKHGTKWSIEQDALSRASGFDNIGDLIQFYRQAHHPVPGTGYCTQNGAGGVCYACALLHRVEPTKKNTDLYTLFLASADKMVSDVLWSHAISILPENVRTFVLLLGILETILQLTQAEVLQHRDFHASRNAEIRHRL